MQSEALKLRGDVLDTFVCILAAGSVAWQEVDAFLYFATECDQPPSYSPPRHLQPASLNLLPQIIYALVVLHYLRFGGLLRSVTERDSRSLSYTVIAIPMINPAAPW